MKKQSNLLLLAGLAGAAFYFLRSKPAKAAAPVLVDPPGDDKPPEDDPVPPSSTPPKNAPALSGSVGSNTAALTSAALTYVEQINAIVIDQMNLGADFSGPPPRATSDEVAVARATFSIPSDRTIASWITDAVYFADFGQKARVPAAQNRGNGWGPYIQIWTNVWNNVKGALIDGVNEN